MRPVCSRSAVDRKIEELTGATTTDALPPVEALDLREAALDEEMRRCERIISLVEDQKTWSGRAEKAMKALEEGRTKKEAEEARLQSTGKEWETYLRKARLVSGMTPRTVHQVFPMVENIKSRLKTLAENEERIRRMEKHQRDYLSIAAGVRTFWAVCRTLIPRASCPFWTHSSGGTWRLRHSSTRGKRRKRD